MADPATASQATGTGVGTVDLTTAQAGTADPKDVSALNPNAGQEPTGETPAAAAKDPNSDPAVAGTKMFAGLNTPATAVDPHKGTQMQSLSAASITPHKITGVDVTQPPALDLESGLARTTIFEKSKDDKESDSGEVKATS